MVTEQTPYLSEFIEMTHFSAPQSNIELECSQLKFFFTAGGETFPKESFDAFSTVNMQQKDSHELDSSQGNKSEYLTDNNVDKSQ